LGAAGTRRLYASCLSAGRTPVSNENESAMSGLVSDSSRLGGEWDSNYAACLNAATCRNQLINGFELMKIWATISKSLISND
jgi:hypothetical protein